MLQVYRRTRRQQISRLLQTKQWTDTVSHHEEGSSSCRRVVKTFTLLSKKTKKKRIQGALRSTKRTTYRENKSVLSTNSSYSTTLGPEDGKSFSKRASSSLGGQTPCWGTLTHSWTKVYNTQEASLKVKVNFSSSLNVFTSKRNVSNFYLVKLCENFWKT